MKVTRTILGKMTIEISPKELADLVELVQNQPEVKDIDFKSKFKDWCETAKEYS